MQVVISNQPRGKDFARLMKVAQISPRIIPAGAAHAGFVQRRGILRIPGISDIAIAASHEGSPIAGYAGGHDAIKQIHTALYAIQKILRRANTHGVTGFAGWQF